MAAGLAALEAVRYLIATTRLADDPAWVETAQGFTSRTAARAWEWLQADSTDLPGPTSFEDAWAILRATLNYTGDGGDGDADPAS